MKKRQYLQYAYNSRTSQQTQEINFISYASQLKKREEKEMQILKRIDYNHAQVSVKKRQQSDIFLFFKEKKKQEAKKNPQEKARRENHNTNKAQDLKRLQKLRKITTKTNQTQKSKHSRPDKNDEYYEIDQCAVVIKGKLIYLKDDCKNNKTQDKLLYVLEQNGIPNKQYLCGDKEKVMQQISKNQNKKQNQIINQYILRNMSEQNNGQIVIMDRFYEIKDNLFD